MAIKGKKKSQTRGSHARRRPASAPRSMAAAPRRRWYETDRGRTVAAVVVALVVVAAWVAVTRAQSRAEDLERVQAAVDSYTDEVRGVLQTVRAPAQDMAEIPSEADPRTLERVADEVPSWLEALTRARAAAGRLAPTPATANANRLFVQSIDLYLAAAETYALVGEVDREFAGDVLTRAAEQRDAAANVWSSATTAVDTERARIDLGASGLGVPSAPTSAPQPALPGAPGGGG